MAIESHKNTQKSSPQKSKVPDAAKILQMQMLEKMWFEGARLGDIGRLDQVLKSAPEFDINCQDEEVGNSALHIVARRGDVQCLCYLIDQLGADVLVQDKSGKNVLHVAQIQGYTQVIKILLFHPSARQLCEQYDSSGATALHNMSKWGALFSNEVSLLKKIMDVSDVGAVDEKGNTALHEAAQWDNMSAAVELVVKSDVHARNNEGNTPLHLAALEGNERMVWMLKEYTSVKQVNNEGNSALHLAVQQGYVGCVQALVEGSDLYTRNDQGKTALECALSSGEKQMARMIQEQVAKQEHQVLQEMMDRMKKDGADNGMVGMSHNDGKQSGARRRI